LFDKIDRFNHKKAINLHIGISKIFLRYCKSKGYEDKIVYCKNSLLRASQEIYYDINFIQNRRLLKGIGKPKIAGIILWRLYKSNFIRFNTENICDGLSKMINPLFDILIIFILKNILKLNFVKIKLKYKQEFEELEYQLRNRHINQESIALFFKVICRAEEGCL
jgi:hypothetical protein